MDDKIHAQVTAACIQSTEKWVDGFVCSILINSVDRIWRARARVHSRQHTYICTDLVCLLLLIEESVFVTSYGYNFVLAPGAQYGWVCACVCDHMNICGKSIIMVCTAVCNLNILIHTYKFEMNKCARNMHRMMNALRDDKIYKEQVRRTDR